MSEARERAAAFLAGLELSFEEANGLWKQLKRQDDLSLAHAVLDRMRAGGVAGGLPPDRELRRELCRQQALLTSKDVEINSGVRHDLALAILGQEFDLEDPALDGDGETLGIAGGILKRRWGDLGQLEDLRKAADCYRRGALGPLGEDAYAQINAAFVEDLLAHAGDDADERRARARAIREQIVAELPVLEDNWWNAATRAEANLGLGRYAEATAALETKQRPDPWELETTARQLAQLVHLRERRPLGNAEVRRFFETLLGGSAPAVQSALTGKVGLALSGGGFRASFYHLGVLARLAELDALRHVEVLSCVSGGSILGACYWLELRRRLLDPAGEGGVDYVDLVRSLIAHFEAAVARDLRGRLQAGKLGTFLRLLRAKGALASEGAARELERLFYRPLLPGDGPLYMDQLVFEPADHAAQGRRLTGDQPFNPAKHNWLRAHKVPALVLNATTVNTGHAWQFTATWMGESPWSVHEVADTVPRLEWHWYDAAAEWRMPLGRAVAASAGVPGVFSPVALDGAYENLVVELVDGGVYDNQGAAALLAHSCNVLLVSDAAGQLKLERRSAGGLTGLAAFFQRSMDTLMERVRQASFGDLSARHRTGLIRGLMFLHMKEGLDADPIRLRFSQQSQTLNRSVLSSFGIRREFQQALAELRTDLDAFSTNESRALMACGYQMAKVAFDRDLGDGHGLGETVTTAGWVFDALLDEITSTATTTPARQALLAELRAGSKVRL